VPHNLISAQENPVPLPMFQMALRLNSSCPLGSRKEPKYTFLFSQKVLPTNPRFPIGAPVERDTHLQGIFTYLDVALYLKDPKKKCPSMFPKIGSPLERDTHSRALLNIYFGVPSKRFLLPGPPRTEMPHS
jgi:hypothetical protein